MLLTFKRPWLGACLYHKSALLPLTMEVYCRHRCHTAEAVTSPVTQKEMGACHEPGSNSTGFSSASVELLPLQILRSITELYLFPKLKMSLVIVHILFTYSANKIVQQAKPGKCSIRPTLLPSLLVDCVTCAVHMVIIHFWLGYNSRCKTTHCQQTFTMQSIF